MRKIEIKKNRLVWGGKIVDEVARKFGTPLYVYDERMLVRSIKELQRGPWNIHYALKANPSPEIMKTMLRYKIGIDAVSENEVDYALRIGFKPRDIIYTSSSLSHQEAKRVMKKGVLINLNSIEEIELYGKIGHGTNIGIRINPEVKAGHHEIVETSTEISKFGIFLKDTEKAISVAQKNDLKIRMVHFHIGSGILNTKLFVRAFNNVLDILRKVTLSDLAYINLGGGFGTPYSLQENRLNLPHLISNIKKLHNEFTKEIGRKTSLIIEPGRYLVNESGILVVNVNTISRNHLRTFYRIDSGFNHLVRPILYGAYHHVVNASCVKGSNEKVVLAGNICEAGDIINQEPREITRANPNDKIAIFDAGAYGISMGMEAYNLRGLPGEVMIKQNGRIIQFAKKQSLNNILSRYAL